MSPPRGQKSNEVREAAVMLPGLLSGLQVKEVTGVSGGIGLVGGKGFICLFSSGK